MRRRVNAINLHNDSALLASGEVIPIETYRCTSFSVAAAVAGPDSAGKWYSIDLSCFCSPTDLQLH